MTPSTTSRPRLVFYLDPAAYGGAVQYVERLLGWLDPDEFQLVVICTREPSLDRFFETIGRIPVEVHELSKTPSLRENVYSRVVASQARSSALARLGRVAGFRELAKTGLALLALGHDYRLLGRVKTAISRVRPTILHANLDHFPDNTGRLALAVGHQSGARGVVATIHQLPQPPVFPQVLQHVFDRRGLRRADRMIAITREVAARLRSWYGARPESLVLIPNGAARDCFDIRQPRVDRSALEIEPGGVLVVHVGSVVPRRGQLLLARALHSLRRRCPLLRALFVGEAADHEYACEFETFLREHGENRLRWLGYRADATELLRLADVSVISSLQELHPFALLEAMALGRAIVATEVGGIPETLMDGRCGLLVPPGDVAGMARAVERLYYSPGLRRDLGREARRRAEDRFSEERMARDTVQVYRSLLGNGGVT